jgi:hypothetical protein
MTTPRSTRSTRGSHCRGFYLGLFLLVSVLMPHNNIGVVVHAYQIPTLKRWSDQLKIGYKRRVAANPSFPAKSLTEVFLAAGTQLAAECNRRGTSRLLPEIDFVFPAILTAVFGKYYRYVSQKSLLLCFITHGNNSNKIKPPPESCQIFEQIADHTHRSPKPIPLEHEIFGRSDS